MAIRIPVTLVIEMDDEQQAAYVAEVGLPFHDGPLRARDVVGHVRSYVLSQIQESGDFGDDGATVTIKER